MPVWTPPADRLPATGTWAAAGVPGGIPNRTTVYDDDGNGFTEALLSIDNTGATDVTAAIQAAIDACPDDEVVVLGPGSFRCDATLNFGIFDHCSLRGTLDVDGTRLTTIVTYSSIGIHLGTGYDFNTSVAVVVASLTKGSTTIEVADSTLWSVGQVVVLSMGNDTTYPIGNVYPLTPNGLQIQIVKITGKPDSTHYTIEAPGCHGDYTTAPNAILITDGNNFSFQASGQGIEDLIIDGTNTEILGSGVQVDNNYASWCRNVEVVGATNYAFALFFALQCELRQCDSGVSNPEIHTTAGHFAGGSTSALFIDNIVRDNPWMIIQQGPNSGNVWAYNLFVDLTRHFSTVNNNHGPWIQYALFTYNLFPFIHSDGYYWGSGYQTYYRNWMYGSNLGYEGTGIAGVFLRRCDRFHNIWGNQIGRAGGSNNGVNGFGSPNLSNSNDIVPGHTSRMCVAALSTRTSDTAGTITAPSGHGVTTGAVIDILWTVEENDYHIAKVRRNVTVGTVSGTSIPFSGGLGDTLPAQDAVMYVPTANSALYNWWEDWDTATMAPRKWTGVLTTRTSDSAGIVTLDPGQQTTFGDALDKAFAGLLGPQRGMMWNETTPGTFGLNRSIEVTDFTGDEVTFANSSGINPDEDTEVVLTPSNFGFQETDMDVLLTTSLKENYYLEGGIPAVESLGGDTLPDSLMGEVSAPQFFIDADCDWPPISPGTPGVAFTESYQIIPAGKRAGIPEDPVDPEFTSEIEITGTAAELGTLTITGGNYIGNPTPTVTYEWRLDGAGGVLATTPSINIPIGTYTGHFLEAKKLLNGTVESTANSEVITEFMGDILTLNQTSNTDPVTELVKRATVGGGAPTEEIIQHSGDYPSQPENGYVYAKHGSTQKHVFVFEGTINLATAIASRP